MLKFGLNVQKKSQGNGARITSTQSSKPKPKAKARLGFGDDDDDDDEQGPAAAGTQAETVGQAEEIDVFDLDATTLQAVDAPPSGAQKNLTSKPKPKPRSNVSQYGDLSALKSSRAHAAEATALDPSIYDYDAAFDALHAKSEAKKAADRADAEQRKPKYINNLLAAADVRKRDQLRARDLMLQKEREAEGEEFAGKEQFVTGAYKQQQEDMHKEAEAEEKRKAEEERKRKTGQGLQDFRRNMLESEDVKHQEAVEAADEGVKMGSVPESKDAAAAQKSDAEIAREINARGGNVILNDEGQVADKRQLLSAGLNTAPKPASSHPLSSSRTKPEASRQQQHAYQGRNAGQRAMRERQTRMLESQLEQASKRAAEDEVEEQQRLEHKAKSRKTEEQIGSAKERYLQRKREAAAAAAEAAKAKDP